MVIRIIKDETWPSFILYSATNLTKIQEIKPELFFDFYGELLLLLSKRVDIVNLA